MPTWSSMAGVTIRPLRTGEQWLLTEFLYEAVWRPDGAPPVSRTALQEPALRRYVEEFGRAADDRCLAAVCDGRVAGAVWVRRMHGFGHVDDATPELAIALYPEYRGRGIGTLLLRAMLELLRQEGVHAGLALRAVRKPRCGVVSPRGVRAARGAGRRAGHGLPARLTGEWGRVMPSMQAADGAVGSSARRLFYICSPPTFARRLFTIA